ncbi:MAG: hypothetical protein ACLPJJ_04870 [Acidocella sp.]|uniref:hypothetical protein n=1 Tax=Acidocella sp. TaxID=50710 RepID=UPI003FC6D133
MKAATLKRLDLLAASREVALLETIQRHNAALKQNEYQRGMLEAYRSRLAASWQSGSVVSAAQARRAGQFAAGTLGAEAQIAESAVRTREQLEAAIADLARLKAHRRKLAQRLREAARRAEAQAEVKAERDRPVRGRTRHVS